MLQVEPRMLESKDNVLQFFRVIMGPIDSFRGRQNVNRPYKQIMSLVLRELVW